MMNSITCCGADCSTCDLYKKMCEGCNELKGRVFHAPEGKACPIYECCCEKNGFKHCGKCSKVPCSIIMETRDPSYSDEEFQKDVKERVARLKGLN